MERGPAMDTMSCILHPISAVQALVRVASLELPKGEEKVFSTHPQPHSLTHGSRQSQP